MLEIQPDTSKDLVSFSMVLNAPRASKTIVSHQVEELYPIFAKRQTQALCLEAHDAVTVYLSSMSDRNPSSCRDRRRRLGTTGLNRAPVPMTSTSLITASISPGAAGSFQALQIPKLPEQKKNIYQRLLTKTLVLQVVQYTAKLQVQDVSNSLKTLLSYQVIMLRARRSK